jgi:hypothetical protein
MNDPEHPTELRMTSTTPAVQRAVDSTFWRVMRDTVNDLISEQVVHRLGSPIDLLDVRVCPLWADHYRVNVLVGEEFVSRRVADSFFLVTDEEGKIVSSSPAIARMY